VYEDAAKQFLKFVLQIPRLAAAQFDTQNKISLEGSSKKNIQKFL
jgi:hypothetical protein